MNLEISAGSSSFLQKRESRARGYPRVPLFRQALFWTSVAFVDLAIEGSSADFLYADAVNFRSSL